MQLGVEILLFRSAVDRLHLIQKSVWRHSYIGKTTLIGEQSQRLRSVVLLSRILPSSSCILWARKISTRSIFVTRFRASIRDFQFWLDRHRWCLQHRNYLKWSTPQATVTIQVEHWLPPEVLQEIWLHWIFGQIALKLYMSQRPEWTQTLLHCRETTWSMLKIFSLQSRSRIIRRVRQTFYALPKSRWKTFLALQRHQREELRAQVRTSCILNNHHRSLNLLNKSNFCIQRLQTRQHQRHLAAKIRTITSTSRSQRLAITTTHAICFKPSLATPTSEANLWPAVQTLSECHLAPAQSATCKRPCSRLGSRRNPMKSSTHSWSTSLLASSCSNSSHTSTRARYLTYTIRSKEADSLVLQVRLHLQTWLKILLPTP